MTSDYTFLIILCFFSSFLSFLVANPVPSDSPSVTGFVHESHSSYPMEEAAIEQCCGKKFRSCCAEAVDYNRPLSCPSNQVATWRMVDCLHRHLFDSNRSKVASQQEAEGPKSMPLRNILCCGIFAENRNDPQNVCQDQCLNAMLSPSLDFADKMFRVQKCRRRNSLFSCFEKCVQHHANDRHSPFDFNTECSWETRLKPGDVYVGAEV